MFNAFQFRLYPTKAQQTKIDRTLEVLRWIYNKTLAVRKNCWEQKHETISLYKTSKLLTQWKKMHPELYHVYSQVLREPQVRVDLAFRAFFRRVGAGQKPGYPRFKGYGRYDSLTYTQFGFRLEKDRIALSKIGVIRINMHRPVVGKIRRLTVRRSSTGKMFVSFIVEMPNTAAVLNNGAIVGVDLGLESFATLSSGQKIPNPRFFRNEECELAKAQRKLSGEKKGSGKWHKRLKVVQRIHERIANKRSNFVHQESRRLVNRFSVIVFEGLNVNGMQQNHCVAKSISDAAWRMFVNATKSKAEEAGSRVVLVNPRGTSQVCSSCGLAVSKHLGERVHVCKCGLEMDRDLNAAINIMRLGLQSLSKMEIKPTTLRGGSSHNGKFHIQAN